VTKLCGAVQLVVKTYPKRDAVEVRGMQSD
jgi:hypothetical protein